MSFYYDKYTSHVYIDDVYDENWCDRDWYDDSWYDDNENCFKQTDIHDYRDMISSKTYSQYSHQNINEKYYY